VRLPIRQFDKPQLDRVVLLWAIAAASHILRFDQHSMIVSWLLLRARDPNVATCISGGAVGGLLWVLCFKTVRNPDHSRALLFYGVARKGLMTRN